MACFKYGIHLTGWVSQAIFITGNSILFTLSVIGNSLIVYLVWGKAQLRSPTYLLMSFLAMSDLLMSLFGQFSFFISITVVKSISCAMDKVLAFMHVTSCISSLLLLSLIAQDRCLHVTKQQRYLSYTSIRFAVTASIACYLFGMMVAAMFIFDDRTVRLLSPIAIAAIGISSFTFICLKSRKIIRIVQEHNKQMHLNCRDAIDRTAVARSRAFEKSVNKSIFCIIAVFFASWTPIIVVMTIYTMHNFLNKPILDVYRIAFSWSTFISYLNGALNPIIYSYRCDAIGREIRRIIWKITRKRSTAPSTMPLEATRKTQGTQETEICKTDTA